MNRQINNPISKVLFAAFTILTLSLVAFPASSASADEIRDIKRHATSVRNQTRTLLNELNRHYIYAPSYANLSGGVAELRQMAEHVRESAVAGCNLQHLAADIDQMDRTYAQIANLLDETELLASQGRVQIEGNTRNVGRVVGSIGDSIYDMQENLYVLTHAVVAQPIQPVAVQRPVFVADFQVIKQPVYSQPVYKQKPVYQKPVYQKPVYQKPVYQKPVYRQQAVAPPVVVRRPSPGAGCPSGGRSGYGGRGPIVTNVETFRVPLDSLQRSGGRY